MKKLNDKHRIAIAMLVFEGKKKIDVAKEIGVIPGTISEWFNDEEFLKEYQKAVRTRINEASAIAQQRIEELMYSQSENVALSAAKDVLSRSGFDATAKSEITQKTIVIDLEDKTLDSEDGGDAK